MLASDLIDCVFDVRLPRIAGGICTALAYVTWKAFSGDSECHPSFLRMRGTTSDLTRVCALCNTPRVQIGSQL